MPTTDENFAYWNDEYSWPSRGDEWSRDWGGPSAQWFGTLLPRLRHFLPASSVVEIGCGQGRWTEFLADNCATLQAVDLSPNCVAVCKERFAHLDHVMIDICDGTSLPMVPDQSVDFIFSFDVLVLAGPDVVRAYLSECRRVLTPEGKAFLHHSNLAAYGGLHNDLGERDLHWRDPDVDAHLVKKFALECGLGVLAQECFRWGTASVLLDAFTVLGANANQLPVANAYVENHNFPQEIKTAREIAKLYGCNSLI